jgi:hypothetical protein
VVVLIVDWLEWMRRLMCLVMVPLYIYLILKQQPFRDVINKEGFPVSHRRAEQFAEKTISHGSFRKISYGTQVLQSQGAAILSTVMLA